MEFFRRHSVLLILLFLAALILRTIHLSHSSLWLDEILQVEATRGSFAHLWQTFPADKPPLDYFFQWVVLRFGMSDALARVHACLIGALIPVAAAWLGWEIDKGSSHKSLAIVLVLLAIANPMLVRFSQEGRPYALLLLAEFLFLACLWRLYKTEHVKPGHWLALAGLMILALWTHYLAFWCAVAALLFFMPIVLKRGRLAWPLLAAALVALAGLPLLLRAMGAAESEFSAPFQPDAWSKIPVYLDIYALGYEWWEHVQYAGVALIVLMIGGGVWGVMRPERRLAGLFAIYLFTAGFFLPFLFYWVIDHWMEMRYTLAGFPGAMILAALGIEGAARGIATLFPQKKNAPLIFTFSLAGVIALSQAFYVVSTPFRRQDWRGLVNRIAQNAEPGTTVLVGRAFNRFGVRHYLERQELSIPVVVADDDPAVLHALLQQGKDVWIVIEGYGVPPAFQEAISVYPKADPPVYGITVHRAHIEESKP